MNDDTPDPERAALMDALGKALDELLNGENAGDKREVGFVLLICPFKRTNGYGACISNGPEPINAITMMRAEIARLKAIEEPPVVVVGTA